MFAKKSPILTATTCLTLEQIRQAVEVLTGKRTCFVRIDFNTHRGQLTLDGEKVELEFDRRREDLIDFDIGDGRHTVRFDDGVALVWNDVNRRVVKTIAGDFHMIWEGNSMNDRRERPLFLDQAQYCARARGITLEELLKTQPV